ncbi:hypothetical protein [Chryseobacterium oryzae]|uniref:DUF3139 domain-containing protein n=1 Tax=Chryseobacterium oryzae TaxID=2929799 RepID=A0ABY4BHY3_9FLAO|nr:hypothetical protein [Chryseobacterium oryzae]UOE37336.1 hypothetical protein MTP08_09675 [Chryseobacterium oryzae]
MKKKALIIALSTIAIIVLSFIVYWNLPIEITYHSEIKKGNTIVENIEDYKKNSYKLPENDDWQTLEQLGLEKDQADKPIYQKYDTENYELYYPDQLGGPYLIYISKEKKWSIDYPKIATK